MTNRQVAPFAALALAWTLLAWAGQAAAADPPVALTDDPCVAAPAIPASIVARSRSLFDPQAPRPAPPVPEADLAAYRQAAAERLKTDWADLCRYRDDDRRLAAAPAAERQVVFMGDSITQNWGLAAPALFSHGVVNRGISGQTTPQMLVRFQADVVALRPVAVHLMAGTNDIAGNTGPMSGQDVRNNIMAMVTLARAGGIRVILAAIPPAPAFPWNPALAPSGPIRDLNAWLEDYARREHLIFVDYYAALAAPDGAMRPELTLDGVHPNREGYAAIDRLARAAIAQVGVGDPP